jgi:hypothetical protein
MFEIQAPYGKIEDRKPGCCSYIVKKKHFLIYNIKRVWCSINSYLKRPEPFHDSHLLLQSSAMKIKITTE